MKKIGIIVVTFNQNIRDLQLMTFYSKTKDMFLWAFIDNSTDNTIKHNNTEYCTHEISYIDMNGNFGLSVAYNHGLKLLLSKSCDWIVLLDQDTTLSNEYFDELIELSKLDNSDCLIYAPIVKSEKQVLSPRYFKKNKLQTTLEKNDNSLFALINSGIVINRAVFETYGMYDENLFLDMVDYDFLWSIYRKNKDIKIGIMRSELNQSFSGNQINNNDKKRFQNYKNDLWTYTKKNTISKMISNYIINKRALHLALNHHDLSFLYAKQKKLENDYIPHVESYDSVDVLLATYNGEKYLNELIDSIFDNDYPNFKILIRDDGSTDNTIKIIEKYLNDFPDKIRLIQDNKRLGTKGNFLELLKHSDAKYTMFADQDDYWLKDKISTTIAYLQNHEIDKLPLLVHTDLMVTDKDLNVVSESFVTTEQIKTYRSDLNNLLSENIATGCTIGINKMLREMVKYNDINNIRMHDWWLVLIASCFGKVVFINKPTIKYRQHGNNEVGSVETSSLKYVANRVGNSEKTSKSINDNYKQAEELLNCYKSKLSSQQLELLNHFIDTKGCGILTKLKVFNKYHLWRSSLLKSIGLLLLK